VKENLLHLSFLVQADIVMGNKYSNGDKLGGWGGGGRERERERERVAHARCSRNADKNLLGKPNKKQCEM